MLRGVLNPAENTALAAVDAAAVVADTAAAVRIPSLTGQERPLLEHLAERARALGLEADLHVHDLVACGRIPATRGRRRRATELVGLAITLPGGRPGRLCLCGHVDVVPAGHGDLAPRPVVGGGRGRLGARPRLGRHEGRRGRRAARPGGAAGLRRRGAGADRGARVRRLRGGRRARRLRGARARRGLRRLPDPRADRLRGRLRAGGLADLRGRRDRPRRARRPPAGGPLGARPLRPDPPGAAGARAGRQRGRRPPRRCGRSSCPTRSWSAA